MSQNPPDFLDNPGEWHGELDGSEIWWVERQEALERAGYMLRPRYRPGWKPSWVGTDKHFLSFEDGQMQAVSVDSFAHVARVHEPSAARVHRRDADL
jgi:hypothetical protein